MLLDCVLPGDDISLTQSLQWTPGLDYRRTFTSAVAGELMDNRETTGAVADYLRVINSDIINAARVEARLRATAPEKQRKENALAAFYIELNPEVVNGEDPVGADRVRDHWHRSRMRCAPTAPV